MLICCTMSAGCRDDCRHVSANYDPSRRSGWPGAWGRILCRRWMRGSPPKVAPLGLSHCLPASVFGPLVPSALRRLASIGWTRRACVTLLAVASGTERCRAQKTKPGEPQDRSRLVRAGDAPAALPALPAPAGLPLLDVDTPFMAELDLAPLLSTLHKPPES